MFKKYAVLIPAYNEELTIGAVLRDWISFAPWAKIVAVNDGSTDKTRVVIDQYAQKHKQNIIAIHLPTNVGKSRAVLEGLKYVSTDYVFMYDADISNFDFKKMLRISDRFLKRHAGNNNCALIFYSTYKPVLRLFYNYSGLRVVPKFVLEELKSKIFTNNKVKENYTIELLINSFLMEKNMEVFLAPILFDHVQKHQKYPLKEAMYRQLKMNWELLANDKDFFKFRKYVKPLST